MSLSENERQIIVSREMEKAIRTFDDMEFNAREGKWEAAANRFYYSLFHVISALLINDGYNVKSHRYASKAGLLIPVTHTAASFRQTVFPIEVKASKQGGMKSLWMLMHEKKFMNAVRCSL